MVEKIVKIMNSAGIHCRPSSVILNKIQEYPNHTFHIVAPGRPETELNSILGLIAMGLHQGDNVSIRVDGEKEDEALETVSGLFAMEFDFPPRA
jgi:phosphotransferase system HPr (HPr) family protein